MAWYAKSAQEVEKELSTDIKNGINEASANTRAEKYGKNSRELPRSGKIDPSLWRGAIILPAVVFVAAAAVYVAAGNYIAAVSVLIAELAAAYAEYNALLKAGKVSESINRVTLPVATVVRDGNKRIIEASGLVPGDVVILRSGDEISADMRIVEAGNLRIDESPLPGGFISAEKTAVDTLEEDAPVAEHANMAYAGCTVVSGYGRAIVCETGEHTFLAPAKNAAPKYEFGSDAETRILARQTRRLSIAAAVLCLIALVVGLATQEMSAGVLNSVISQCVTLAAAVIPLGLCIAQIVVLTVAMRRLARRGAVVKSFRAMEELDRVDTLILPKTGVITSEEMTATAMWSGGVNYDISGRGWAPEGRFSDEDDKDVDISRRRDAALTLIAAALCANSDIEEVSAGQWVNRGDPTECALVCLAAKAGLFRADMNEMFPRIALLPYEPVRRRMTSIHSRDRKAVAYSKGAPELILASCASVSVGGRAIELSDDNRAQLTEIYTRMTEQGLRVLAVSYKELGAFDEDTVFGNEAEEDMIFLGFIGIENRVAHSSVSAFNLCQSADIRPIMVSGDDMGTTSDAALSLGIHEAVFDGREIDSISPKELINRIRLTRACARVTGQGKYSITAASQADGRFVASAGMTASDASSVRIADIGVALGSSSAESVRRAADVVLDEGSFSELTHVIEESRRAFASLRSHAIFAMCIGLAAIIAVIIGYVSGRGCVMTPVHFAWLHTLLALVTALVPEGEKGERNVMRVAPRSEGETVLNVRSIVCAAVQALVPAGLMVAALFIASARATNNALSAEDTAVYYTAFCFVSFMLMTLAFLFPSRSEHTSVIRLGVFESRPQTAITLASIAVLILGTYVPFLRGAFDLYPLALTDWLIALAFAVVTFAWGEIFKVVLRPVFDRVIKVNPSKVRRRSRHPEFGEGFFSRFENADPTQDEPVEKPGDAEMQEPASEIPAEAEEYAEEDGAEIIESDESEQTAPDAEEPAEEATEDSEAAEETDTMDIVNEIMDEVLSSEEFAEESAAETAETEEIAEQPAEAEEPETVELAPDASEEAEKPAEDEETAKE